MPGAVYVYNSNATITGICRDSLTGTPLAGVEVAAYYPDGWGDPDMEQYVTTGADGRYTLTVDSGEYRLGTMGPSASYQAGWYNGEGLWTTADPITVWAGTTTTINFTIYRKLAVYRFFNFTNNTHFFTDSIEERDMVIAAWPDVYRYEGIAYFTSPQSDLQPLYRFYNVVSKSHFYTASLDEANRVLVTWPGVFRYDGPTYRVSPAAVPGKSPVYRFYNKSNGSHFYTASLDEANHVILTWPDVYSFEGPAFWVGQ